MTTEELKRIIEGNYYIDKKNGCWIWTRSKLLSGYGRFVIKGKEHLVHRLSYQLYFGLIPDGMFVLHSCDNPPCINPGHLRLGTQKENIRDCIERGRRWYQTTPHSEWITKYAKLKPSDIVKIRELLWQGEYQYKIAEMFGVSQGRISAIKNNKTWIYDTETLYPEQDSILDSLQDKIKKEIKNKKEMNIKNAVEEYGITNKNIVLCINDDGVIVNEFNTQIKAAQYFKTVPSNISRAINKGYKAMGYYFANAKKEELK